MRPVTRSCAAGALRQSAHIDVGAGSSKRGRHRQHLRAEQVGARAGMHLSCALGRASARRK